MGKRQRAVCRRGGCQGAAYTRGVCSRCYQVVVRLVRQGLTTWVEQETLGHVAQGQRVPNGVLLGSVTQNWFLEGTEGR